MHVRLEDRLFFIKKNGNSTDSCTIYLGQFQLYVGNSVGSVGRFLPPI